jgi:hypothetical protein
MAGTKARLPMTAAQQSRFAEMLAVTCNVTLSAREAGCSYQAAYRMRRRSAGFRRRWAEALAEGVARLELKLLQRALGQAEELPEGVAGAEAGRKEPSDRVILHLLASHRRNVIGPIHEVDHKGPLIATLRRMRGAGG